MARFPLYIDMKGRKVIVCGGGRVALRKVRTLTEFEADIFVVSPKLHEGLGALADAGQIHYECGDISVKQPQILDSAFLVICATEDSVLNGQIADYCRDKGIWVDCADSAERSSCIFPSVVRRNEIVIGISTSGGVPALTKHLRSRIEKAVPDWYGKLEQSMRIKREQLKHMALTPQEKRERLRAMIEEAERGKRE